MVDIKRDILVLSLLDDVNAEKDNKKVKRKE